MILIIYTTASNCWAVGGTHLITMKLRELNLGCECDSIMHDCTQDSPFITYACSTYFIDY